MRLEQTWIENSATLVRWMSATRVRMASFILLHGIDGQKLVLRGAIEGKAGRFAGHVRSRLILMAR